MSSRIFTDLLPLVDVMWLKKQISGVTAQQIYAQLSLLIRTEKIPSGTRLPAIKELAHTLNYSTRTLYDVFYRLYDDGALLVEGAKKEWRVVTPSGQPLPELTKPLSNEIDLVWCKSKITDTDWCQIYLQFSQLINRGVIKTGTIMPAIADIAATLDVSTTTMKKVWAELQDDGIFVQGYRKKMVVARQFADKLPLRFAGFNQNNKKISLDLTYARSETALLPDLKQAIINSAPSEQLNHYRYQAITPDLQNSIKKQWPYQAGAFITVSAVQEGLYLLLKSMGTAISSIAVETPTSMSIIEILNDLNIEAIPVECDQYGPLPEHLAFALYKKPTLFLYQPRVRVPSGHTVSQQRMAELSEVLKSCQNVFIAEIDLVGGLVEHQCPALSLGQYYPERTIYIRSYSKAYGPDIRLAILSSTYSIVQQIKHTRSLSVDSDSRLLQQALAWLIGDQATQQQIIKAQAVYVRRLNLLVDTLDKLGVNFEDCRNIGQSLWLPVPSEQKVVDILAAEGILTLGGSNFMVGRKRTMQEYIRLSTSLLPDEHIEHVATVLAKTIYITANDKFRL